MEKFYADPLFWTLVLFALAFIIYLFNNRTGENVEVKILFGSNNFTTTVPWITNQYFHFGIKDGENIKRNPSLINSENQDPITYNYMPCPCTDDSPFFVDTWQLTGTNIPTEGNNPPSSTISTPTGTHTPKKEGIGLSIFQHKQYANNPITTSLLTQLPLTHITPRTLLNTPKVKIALIDTGLKRTGQSTGFLSGAQLINCGDFDREDTDGHGTFVYYFTKVGLALKGITDYEIYPYNVADEAGDIAINKVMCAMVHAAANQVKTINLSFGLYAHLPQFIHFINLFLIEYSDIKIICSAGNHDKNIADYNGTEFPFPTPANEYPHPTSYYRGVHQNNIYQITALGINSDTGNIQPCLFTNHSLAQNIGCQGSFKLIIGGNNCLIEGTSFASPIFAGYYSNESSSSLYSIVNNITNVTSSNNHKIAVSTFLPNEF